MPTKLTIAVTAATFALVPLAASAQASGETSQKVQGSPNAAGYGKGDQGSTSTETRPSEQSGKMKGPPNANGAASRNGDKN